MPTHLLIDAREAQALAAVWSKPLLGLSVVGRAIKAARRAGLSAVTVLADPEAEVSAAGIEGASLTTLAAHGDEFPESAIYMHAAVLAEVAWLVQAAAAPVSGGEIRRFGSGVALCGGGALLEDAASAVAGVARDGELTTVLRSLDDWPQAERRLMAALVKQTDGFMARHFARPISLWLSRRLARTAMTPNAMTMISLMIGLAAAPFFLTGHAGGAGHRWAVVRCAFGDRRLRRGAVAA